MGVREPQAGATPVTAVEALPDAPQSLIDTKRWWKHRNLRALNLWLLIPLLSIFSQGVSTHTARPNRLLSLC